MVHPRLKSTRSKSGGAKAAAGDRDDRLAGSRLEEARGLAAAISLHVLEAECVNIVRPSPATLLGRGTVDRLGTAVKSLDIELVVVDGHLSPGQQRNLEKAWACKVIDRTGLILEIFGERAKTREGMLQVELAHLNYQKSRLVRSWTHLERQRGGFGFMGGPGETQIELDRRLIGERIVRLKKELQGVVRTRQLHRDARKRVPYPIVALVGYTNAGKSTLFNTLTSAHVAAMDQLFATLDPTMRQLKLPSGRTIILSDTVGFVSDLPHELVAAFRATLEEVLEADVIVHVRDIAHDETEPQKRDVEDVLGQLGISPDSTKADAKTIVEALNKIDLLSDEDRLRVVGTAARSTEHVALSAITGEGVDRLLARIDKELSRARDTVDVLVPLSDGATLAWIYRRGEVLHRRDDEAHARLTVLLDPADLARLEKQGVVRAAPLAVGAAAE
ncbi:MAG: GTPase HflX [Rhodospirillaceae bacterium]|nr:GTPase HflX [Rhodospirillaceae bacterium]